MKISFTKRTIGRLHKELKTTQRLNNLRLFKIPEHYEVILNGTSLTTLMINRSHPTRGSWTLLGKFHPNGRLFVRLAGEYGRGVATPDEARRILGVASRRG